MSDVIPAKIRQRLFAEGKFLVSKIDHTTIESIESWILANRIGDHPQKLFTLVINSSGGSPGPILYFASFLKTLSPEVKIQGIAFGECGSSALALLQLCHERVAVEHCGFFIHHVSNTLKVCCQDVNWSMLKQKIEYSKRLEAELVKIQTSRSGMSMEDWQSLADFGQKEPGSAIFPEQAKEFGLVDRVVKSCPLF